MNSEKKAWISIAAGAFLIACGLATLIYFRIESLAQTREDLVAIHSRIVNARQTIEGTEALEREVIVLREISTTIDQILPDAEDLNNLIHKFYAGTTTFREDLGGIRTAYLVILISHFTLAMLVPPQHIYEGVPIVEENCFRKGHGYSNG